LAQVIVIGGFSALTNDYNPKAYVFDLGTNEWLNKDIASPGARLDCSCLWANVGGSRKTLFAGGWNNMALQDSGYYDPKGPYSQHFIFSNFSMRPGKAY